MNVKGLMMVGLTSLFVLTSCGTAKKYPPKTITKIIRDTIIVNKHTEQLEMTRAAKLDNYKINVDKYPAVGQDERIRYLVMHYTAIDNDLSLKVLSERDVSAHYLVTDLPDNQIHLLVDETKRAWHAGVSKWKNIDNLNFTSIGIEIVNKGFADGKTNKAFMPFPDHQIKKVGELAKDIVERYKILPVNVVGHSDIAPGRKPDPGPQFPWKRLYDEYKVGAWYEEADKLAFITQYPLDADNYSFILSVQNEFKKYGYDVPTSGKWDDATRKVILSFQYHFRPQRYEGTMDPETWAILKALNKKYNP